MPKNKVTICIVNYKTAMLTKLCLRSIRKFTRHPYEVIVVDNDSQDESLDYLRSLSWIKLIERPGQVAKSGSWAHGTALDIGLQNTKTEFFLSLHSDAIPRKPGWLTWLVAQIKNPPHTACVGSGKLDVKPAWQEFLKKATDVRAFIRRLTAEDSRKYDFYVRTICALYRTDVLRKENLSFSMGVDEGVTCGKRLYFELIDRKLHVNLISERKMSEMVSHIAHATMAFNPEFKVRSGTERKCKVKLDKLLGSPAIQSIMSDDSLDK